MTYDSIENVRLSADGTAVVILDQTLLPNETRYPELREAAALREAITSLRVRGAPAIGIFAAFALYVLARQSKAGNYESFYAEVIERSAYLGSARPTAVNLFKQLRRMEKLVESLAGADTANIGGHARRGGADPARGRRHVPRHLGAWSDAGPRRFRRYDAL